MLLGIYSLTVFKPNSSTFKSTPTDIGPDPDYSPIRPFVSRQVIVPQAPDPFALDR